MSASTFSVRSFRDPMGCLGTQGNRILRLVTDPAAAASVSEILALAPVRAAIERGAFIGSRVVTDKQTLSITLPQLDQPVQLIVEHDPIAFPSYPYEWPPEMLWAAGACTIDLAQGLLPTGFGLKDATPYNVLFRGPRPVFVDLLSLERRDPQDPIWTPAAQFSRMFNIPLLLGTGRSASVRTLFLVHRDGIPPEVAFGALGPLRRLLPPALGLVTLPTLLARVSQHWEASLFRPRRLANAEQAHFVFSRTLARQRRILERLRPHERASAWTSYMDGDCTYAPETLTRKEAFVREVLGEHRPEWVLDVGCNTGHFSALAARTGATVVAIDSDEAVVGRTWQRATAENLAILPLVVDLARPTPPVGWCNDESLSFLHRAHGRFDALLMLAVFHHLLVAERIPLRAITALVATLCRRLVIVEYVGKEDAMFRRIARGREPLYQTFDRASFEEAWSRHFSLGRVEHLPGGHRSLYAWTKGAPRA